ncbi:hypothetical protein Tco_0068287 [Tanacetum coccineum]
MLEEIVLKRNQVLNKLEAILKLGLKINRMPQLLLKGPSLNADVKVPSLNADVEVPSFNDESERQTIENDDVLEDDTNEANSSVLKRLLMK